MMPRQEHAAREKRRKVKGEGGRNIEQLTDFQTHVHEGHASGAQIGSVARVTNAKSWSLERWFCWIEFNEWQTKQLFVL